MGWSYTAQKRSFPLRISSVNGTNSSGFGHIYWRNSFFFFLFINKHIYNRHITKIKKGKTKIHITVITCKATVRPEIKLKKEQLKN